MKNILFVTLVLCSQVITDNFLFENKTDSSVNFSFNIGEFSIDSQAEYDKINTLSEGTLQQQGEPELPLFSFNYAIQGVEDYDVEFTVLDYEIIEDINIYPHQLINASGPLSINTGLYKSDLKYPLENIQYNKSSLRGYEMLSITFIPFEYDFNLKELKVFKQVEISINEITLDNLDRSNSTPRSMIFENMYKKMIINEDVRLDDSRNIQKPSILYICGGNVATSDYDSFFKPLVEWRRKQGYVVNVASVNETGTSTTAIKNYISNAYYNWENPPEFVCLVGDANGSIDVNTYNVTGGSGGGWGGATAEGEGDFPYTLLEGNDIVPDMIIGRMSVSNTGELYTVVNKIIGYEKNYSGETDWITTAALVGDPYDSGISTVITNEYINTIMDIHGGMSTINTMYSGTGFDTFMRNQINSGVSYLNYRGFYGFSGFTQNDINSLTNGFRLPFLTTLTCDTGSFAEDNSCITEGLFRAGSVNSPKGAIAVIGTAQPYTHTAFNNMVNMGIYDGLFLYGAQTAGEALVYGQLALNEIYPQNPNDNVYLFSTWNNLMGDPSTHLWTGNPTILDVNHNSVFVQGSDNFQVNVKDNIGNPIPNATVSIYQLDGSDIEIQMTSNTDDSGIADFILDNPNSGRILVTSRCQNCVPVESYFDVTNDTPRIELNQESLVIDDSSNQTTYGNNDGYLNPSEVVELSFNLVNNSAGQISNGQVSISSLSESITIINNSVAIESIASFGQVEVSGLSVQVSSHAFDSENADIRVSFVSDGIQWDFELPISIKSGEFLLETSIINDNNNNGILDRGESALLDIEMYNLGSINLQGIVGSINFSSLVLDIDTSEITFSDLQVGQSANAVEPITLTANSNITNGTIISIPIEITTESGYSSSQVITFQIGEVSVTDPLGPDLYGYYIYDQNDDYELAPTYDWIEIDPGYGGSGQQVNINDNGDNGDDTSIVNLPFDFTFYGIEYDRLSICSNGWISFGETDMESFRNYTLPGPGGPAPIVAVFWDDLMTTGNGDVYTYYDQSNDYFVIEWSDVRTFYNNTEESFQVILYNTDTQTLTGDDEMKLQYKEFNNNSVGDYPVGNYDGAVVHGQYCTVGIENHLANDGLQYTYNNIYPEAAMSLSDGTALFITTGNPYLYATPELNLNEDEIYVNLQSNEELSLGVNLYNNGEEGSLLNYESNISVFGSSVVEVDDFGYSWTKSSVDDDVEYNWINIDDDNTVLVLPNNDSGSIANFNFNFPFYGSNYSFCAVMANGWLSFGALSEAWNNQSVFEEDSPRPAIFGFWDDLNPENLDGDGQGQIKYHSNNERTVIWYDNVIHWTGENRIYDFQIVLYPSGKIALNYRSMQGNTGSATIGIIDSNGNYGLEALYNQDGFMEDNISVLFDTTKGWSSILSNQTGQIGSDQSSLIELGINTQNLDNGSYNSFLIINSNASPESSVIPINLIVSESGLILGDLNQDGVLDVLDVVRLIQIILGQYDPSNFELMLSDLNEDEIVNVQDIVLMINTILTF